MIIVQGVGQAPFSRPALTLAGPDEKFTSRAVPAAAEQGKQ